MYAKQAKAGQKGSLPSPPPPALQPRAPRRKSLQLLCLLSLSPSLPYRRNTKVPNVSVCVSMTVLPSFAPQMRASVLLGTVGENTLSLGPRQVKTSRLTRTRSTHTFSACRVDAHPPHRCEPCLTGRRRKKRADLTNPPALTFALFAAIP